MSGSNPPSTNGSPRVTRRAVLIGLTVLTAMALPAGLVATTSDAASAQPAPGASGASRSGATSTPTTFGRFHSLAVSVTPAVIELPAEAPVAAPRPVAAKAAATPAPTPVPAPAPRAVGDPADPASWDRLAGCEANGNWATNTGNGYYGGLQFSLSSWHAVGGNGYPNEASRETQIELGRRLYNQGGWDHWPGCTRSFGWR